MLNSNELTFISHLSNYLPDRRPGKRGTKPIPKEILLEQLFLKFRKGLGWRDIKYSSTARNYLKEIQRRGEFKSFFNYLIQEFKKYRPSETIVDSSDLVSYQTNGLIKYSGKYHNYCIKITVEVTKNCLPINFSLNPGSMSDSLILDKMLERSVKLPYELYLDKGYERYDRRRELKRQNCQVRMEMKKDKNRKRGPCFTFNKNHKDMRGSIEKIYGWLKSFGGLVLNKLRIKSNIMAMFIIALSYYAFRRL